MAVLTLHAVVAGVSERACAEQAPPVERVHLRDLAQDILVLGMLADEVGQGGVELRVTSVADEVQGVEDEHADAGDVGGLEEEPLLLRVLDHLPAELGDPDLELEILDGVDVGHDPVEFGLEAGVAVFLKGTYSKELLGVSVELDLSGELFVTDETFNEIFERVWGLENELSWSPQYQMVVVRTNVL